MPRERGRDELPSTIERSPAHAQHIWIKAHDSAIKTYGEGPQAARRPTTPKKSTDPHRLPTASGKIARTVAEARRKAREAKREYARGYRRRKKRAA